jgi:S-adenosylmethionine synthetase
MMALADEERLDAVLCIPQKSAHVPDRATYIDNCAELLRECHRKARDELPNQEAIFRVNARDIVANDEIYLTCSGSSIESGDEGLVGRGNRVNGLITPLRPMNLEGANGKNPVYHVGKLYNVVAQRIARELHEIFGGYVEVHLVSATGQPLATPWRTLVRMSQTGATQNEVRLVVEKVLSSISTLTREIIYGRQLLA